MAWAPPFFFDLVKDKSIDGFHPDNVVTMMTSPLSGTLDKGRFDEFKTRFYRLQGWDTATGYPSRAALEPLGLGYVADELEKAGKLGEK